MDLHLEFGSILLHLIIQSKLDLGLFLYLFFGWLSFEVFRLGLCDWLRF